MSSMDRDLLLIVLATLAESFMLWVLWNFIKASGERKSCRSQAASRPSSVVSIQKGRLQEAAWHQETTSTAPTMAEKRRA
jgi:hypothetical protein